VYVLEFVDPVRNQVLGGRRGLRAPDQRISGLSAQSTCVAQQVFGKRVEFPHEGGDDLASVLDHRQHRLTRVEATDVEDQQRNLVAVEIVEAAVGGDLGVDDPVEQRERLCATFRACGRRAAANRMG
jgi:hypothetical protein